MYVEAEEKEEDNKFELLLLHVTLSLANKRTW